MRAKDVLCSLKTERDGVDGSSVYRYGEGWDFGEVAKNGCGVNASQFNLPETGIQSYFIISMIVLESNFNDRIRVAILGGSSFGHPLQQGFATALFLQPNGHNQDTAGEKLMLAVSKDHIQVGMAANLRDIVLTDYEGRRYTIIPENKVKGLEVLTHDGVPVSYASCPTETVRIESKIA
ncbi:hypothetical protein FEM48_Zijuj03G0057700 [Ziziphus jujuba var. spinosa]|uniref:Uncharacterized protein n=1 Tax=Ziziphus jujuba var. spinosa TaxID=714518 RepID=A0A978VNJ1_ZIZJJ|nr:hypothetical protein FEM48_Zijuj03G0057700 [Ziziphus jujuba var. spinosa]